MKFHIIIFLIFLVYYVTINPDRKAVSLIKFSLVIINIFNNNYVLLV